MHNAPTHTRWCYTWPARLGNLPMRPPRRRADKCPLYVLPLPCNEVSATVRCPLTPRNPPFSPSSAYVRLMERLIRASRATQVKHFVSWTRTMLGVERDIFAVKHSRKSITLFISVCVRLACPNGLNSVSLNPQESFLPLNF